MLKPYSIEAAKGKLFIWGGDGERDSGQGEPNESGEESEQDSGEQQDSGPDGDQGNSVQDSNDGGNAGVPSVEDQLDAERQKSIKLAKQIEKLTQAQDKSKADKDAAAERDEIQTKYDSLKTIAENKLLAWSIGSETKYQWNDINDVKAFIKPEEINTNLETGEIEGLDLALKRIAKEKPYLLKKKSNDDSDSKRPPSGSHPQGGSAASDDLERKRLGQKFKIPGYGATALKPM